MNRGTTRSAVLFCAICSLVAHRSAAQDDDFTAPPAAAPPTGAPQKEGPVIIDSPPPPAPGTVLQRPGEVLVQGYPVQVRFQSPTPGLTFQLQTGSQYSAMSGVSYNLGYGFGYPYGYGWGWGGIAPYYGEVITKSFQPICAAPCVATLLSGRHRFSLSLDGEVPVQAGSVDIFENAVVEGRYVSKKKLRRIGWAVFVAGTIAGMAMMFASVDYSNNFDNTDQIRNRAVFFSGVGLFSASIVAGAALAAQRDEASVIVYPQR